ncbi:MAG: hypothetical protein FWE06_01220 [Oscillospiraceae bacterium]|nr:hypothetical protein [Oscillospiraceae bacterium]
MKSQKPLTAGKSVRKKGLQVSSYFRARIAALIMTLIVIAGQTWIAYAINLDFIWILPLISGVMLTSSILAYSGSHRKPSRLARALSIAVVILLPLINLICMGWFIYDMLNPATVTLSHELLLAGFALWVVNIGVFALAYWELDTGGPEVRALGFATVFRNKIYPDFVFPQQTSNDSRLAPENWTPGFIDYLYVSITTATSFSPAALTPYSHMAKIMAGAEALVSLFILGLIVTRAMSLSY